MSLKTQAKVLRALQEQVIDPVGGAASVRVDVRVIAATNKDLPTEIRADRFREDLYFRLNVIPVFVPPLRERDEDVPRLAAHFMGELSREYGRRPKAWDPGALAALRSYGWPGNVRELRNVIERLLIMVPGDTISIEHLTFLDGVVRAGELAGTNGPVLPLHEARERFERDYILRTLAEQQGNISRTAEVLDVERSNLYRKMRAFGIAPARRGGESPADERRCRSPLQATLARAIGSPARSARAERGQARGGEAILEHLVAVTRRRRPARRRARSSSAARGTRPMISLSAIAAPARSRLGVDRAEDRRPSTSCGSRSGSSTPAPGRCARAARPSALRQGSPPFDVRMVRAMRRASAQVRPIEHEVPGHQRAARADRDGTGRRMQRGRAVVRLPRRLAQPGGEAVEAAAPHRFERPPLRRARRGLVEEDRHVAASRRSRGRRRGRWPPRRPSTPSRAARTAARRARRCAGARRRAR